VSAPHVVLRLNEIGRGTLVVNGVSLGHLCRATTIEGRVGSLTTVTLELHGVCVEAEVDVRTTHLVASLVRPTRVSPAEPDLTAHSDAEWRRFAPHAEDSGRGA
jgi:hypothetical protein